MSLARSCTIVFCLLLAGTVSATTIVAPTFEQLVDEASEIFVCQVVSQSSRWVSTREWGTIMTAVTFSIEEGLKGDLRTQTLLEFMGGTVDDVTLRVDGMPHFAVGDRVVLFVERRQNLSPLVGFMHGRFRIERDSTIGRSVVARDDGRRFSTTAALGTRDAAPQPDSGLTLDQFRAAIVARLQVKTKAVQ